MNRTAPLLAMLGADWPVIQAPIGGSATVDLVAEVGRAGGAGGLALTWDEPAAAVAKVRAAKRRCGQRFFVNYVLRFKLPSLEAVLAEGFRR
jgi:NAD(P)H-dependent flavin oxidoreductase YrpB (nitropropane dioxygenase family)